MNRTGLILLAAGAALLCGVSHAAAQRRPAASPPSRAAAVHPANAGADPASTAPHDPWLAPDKLQHLSGSFAIAVFTHAAVMSVASPREAMRVSLPAAALAGIAKEVYDRRTGGFFSARDLAADAAGVVAAWLILREVR